MPPGFIPPPGYWHFPCCGFLVTKSCPTPCNPMNCSTSVFPVLHHLPEFAQTQVHWVSDAIHLILCHPLLLLPSIFPSIRVFSSVSALCIRWPEYRAFSLSKHQTKGMLCYVPRCVLNRPAIQGHSVFWNWSTAYTSACPWAQGTHASSPQVQASPSL